MSISVSSSSSHQRPDMAEMRAKLFKTADGDENGTLSKTELTTAMKNAPKPPAGGPGGPKHSSSSSSTDSTGSVQSTDDIFAQMDADGSGEVTQDEMKTFDDARQSAMEAKRSENFDGSGDFLKKILDELSQDESSDSSSSTSSTSSSSSTSTSATSSRDELINLLIKKLQEQNPTYELDGNTSSSDTVGLFSKTV